MEQLRKILQEATSKGWTNGIKKLFGAGAKREMAGVPKNPLTLALQNHDCAADHIGLLLKHGADPNDHDGRFQNIPLLYAIKISQYNQDVTKIVELLLENGADPNVTYKGDYYDGNALSTLLGQRDVTHEVFAALFKSLVDFEVNLNYDMPQECPLVHGIMFRFSSSIGHYSFLQEQLDLFFLHGCNINIDHQEYKTAVEFAVTHDGHSNSIRWLIRHGADISPVKISLLKGHFSPCYVNNCFPETPLILLWAGMRVSHEAQTHLRNIEVALSAWLQDSTRQNEDIAQVKRDLWTQLEKSVETEAKRMQYNLKKKAFPEFWPHQTADLQEFSDESLNVYPEQAHIFTSEKMHTSQYALSLIHSMLEFLSQPQSLQWYCRSSVRENLVSLQPSVVKTLPLPSKLKRFILCHEI